MKLPFRRNNKEDVPAEIQEYYQAERRERVGVAWAVALLTLVVTVGIVMGLFFGGRWLYRTLSDRGRNEAATTQTQEQQPSQPAQSAPPQASAPAPQGGQQGTPPAVSSPQQGTGSASGSGPAAPPQTSSTRTGAGTAQTGNVPNSGPGEVIGFSLLAAVAAGMAHRYFRVRGS